MNGFLKSATVVVFSAVLGLGAASARAAGVNVTSGNSYDGWKIFFPEGEGVTLVEDSQTSALELVLDKTATFSTTQGFLITFMQDKTVSAPATSIEIANEAITNNSGVTWSGFNFLLLTPFTGPTFAPGHVFIPAAGYDTVSAGSSVISYGGSQANGTTSNWGQADASGTNDLLINSSPLTGGSLQSFTFKEIPSVGVSVPVPAALWTSLTLLAGLGLIANRKSIVRALA